MTNEIKELGKLIEQLVDMLDSEPTPSGSEGKPELPEHVKKMLDAGRERAFLLCFVLSDVVRDAYSCRSCREAGAGRGWRMNKEGTRPREQVWRDERGTKRVLLCPKCAHTVSRIDRFCSHCGQNLAQTAP